MCYPREGPLLVDSQNLRAVWNVEEASVEIRTLLEVPQSARRILCSWSVAGWDRCTSSEQVAGIILTLSWLWLCSFLCLYEDGQISCRNMLEVTLQLHYIVYFCAIFHHHRRHKRQGLDPLIRSVSRVTAARANASSVFQLFLFLVAPRVIIDADR